MCASFQAIRCKVHLHLRLNINSFLIFLSLIIYFLLVTLSRVSTFLHSVVVFSFIFLLPYAFLNTKWYYLSFCTFSWRIVTLDFSLIGQDLFPYLMLAAVSLGVTIIQLRPEFMWLDNVAQQCSFLYFPPFLLE